MTWDVYLRGDRIGCVTGVRFDVAGGSRMTTVYGEVPGLKCESVVAMLHGVDLVPYCAPAPVIFNDEVTNG